MSFAHKESQSQYSSAPISPPPPPPPALSPISYNTHNTNLTTQHPFKNGQIPSIESFSGLTGPTPVNRVTSHPGYVGHAAQPVGSTMTNIPLINRVATVSPQPTRSIHPFWLGGVGVGEEEQEGEGQGRKESFFGPGIALGMMRPARYVHTFSMRW